MATNFPPLNTGNISGSAYYNTAGTMSWKPMLPESTSETVSVVQRVILSDVYVDKTANVAGYWCTDKSINAPDWFGKDITTLFSVGKIRTPTKPNVFVRMMLWYTLKLIWIPDETNTN